MLVWSDVLHKLSKFSPGSQQHESSFQEVLNSLPLAQLRIGNAKPEGWDSEAFCTNLHYAYLGVHSNGTFPFSQPHICSLIRAYEMGHVKGGLQAKIVKLLKAHIPNEFPRIFGRRFRDLGMDQAAIQSFISPVMGTFSLELKPLLSALPLSTPMALIRTWSNGWFTSIRMHESIALPCIFGCDAEDNLDHYLKCDILWTLIYCCNNCKTTIFRQTIDNKACVRGLCRANLARLYTAFSTYHSLRKLHTEQITEAISSGNFNSVHETAIELIKLFLTESCLAT